MIPRDILIHYVCPLLYYTEDSETLKQMGVTEEDADKWCYHIQPHGEIKTYFATGELYSHYFYKEGKLHGDYKYYFSTGEEDSKFCYKEGEFHGEYIRYFSNGGLRVHYFYKDGNIHGVCKLYSQLGRFMAINYYINGKEVNKWRYKLNKIGEWFSNATN